MSLTGASVTFESVSKRFFRGTRHGALGDLVSAVAAGLLKGRTRRREPFWALRDISFAVGPGDALGIIGPNGSGKSTVLRLLAGILRPEEGRVVVRGPDGRRPRLGALLEVAAGFHYELTGSENVYLQGAVLGMRRAEIARKFDDIVDFAELGPFIDTPVKHYSSGMNARLGFSIAAHLDPDVLVIDEALAVGDDAFQRKAFSRLAETVRRDVPAIVVSHQLHRVTELCSQAILLTRGRVVAAGSPDDCINAYVGALDSVSLDTPTPVRLLSLVGPHRSTVDPGERVTFRIRGAVTQPGGGKQATVGIRARSLPREELVFVVDTARHGVMLPDEGEFEIEVDVRMNVTPGTYRAQSVVWDSVNRHELTRGRSATIGVSGPPVVRGGVFVDPRVRLIDP